MSRSVASWRLLRPVVGRSLNAVFFLVTAVYGFLASSQFAYLQFIRPEHDRVLNWRLVREQIDQIARQYGFSPES